MDKKLRNRILLLVGGYTRAASHSYRPFGVRSYELSSLLDVPVEEIQLHLDALQAEGLLVQHRDENFGVSYTVTTEGDLLVSEFKFSETIQDILIQMALRFDEGHLPHFLGLDFSSAALDTWLHASDKDLRHLHPNQLRKILLRAEKSRLLDANESNRLYLRWRQQARVVFICYSSSDRYQVRELYRRLQSDGMNPWLDEEDLLPGQNWQEEIEKSLRRSDVVIVCLSCSSISKTGFVQKEIRLALDAADLRPPGTIFIIPARLEDCEVPQRLTHLQWVDLFEKDGYKKLLASLNRAKTVPASPNKGPQADG